MDGDVAIFDDADELADEAAMLEGEADVKAGRTVPHEEVVKWLRTWGSPDEQPPPAEWFE